MRSTRSSARRRARIAEYGGLAPAAVLPGGLFGFALVLTVLYSFWQVVDFEVRPDWTLGNYTYLFSVDTYVRTFLATLWMVALATVLTLAAAFPFAYWLARYVSRRWRRRLLVIVVLPFFASYLLRIYAWLSILGQNGAINRPARGHRRGRPAGRCFSLQPPCRGAGARLPVLPVRRPGAVRGTRAVRLDPARPPRWTSAQPAVGRCARDPDTHRYARDSRPA